MYVCDKKGSDMVPRRAWPIKCDEARVALDLAHVGQQTQG